MQHGDNDNMGIRIKSGCLVNKKNRSSDLIRRSTKNIATTNHGFTLVELAIALMVIGLLIGGVLKGQELIENAKITATIRQVKAYDAATMIFRNTYNALPGDIKRPNRIPNCTEDSCNVSGNGNGRIQEESALTPRRIEIANFFPHLTKAGMIQGPEGGRTDEIRTPAQSNTTSDEEIFLFHPTIPFGHYLILRYETSGVANYNNGHYYIIPGNSPPNTGGNLSVRQFIALDEKLDDGRPYTGSVGLIEWGRCPAGDGSDYLSEEYDPESAYAQDHEECDFIIKAEF